MSPADNRQLRVSPPVEIQVASAQEGNDLTDCLVRHGLPAHLVERGGTWRVELRSPHEDPKQLLSDLFGAVESLRPDRTAARPLRRIGELRYALQSRIRPVNELSQRNRETSGGMR